MPYTVFPTPSSSLGGPEVNRAHCDILNSCYQGLLHAWIEPVSHKSKALCIEPRSTLTFGVSRPPRHMHHGVGLLSDHEVHDCARPGRRKYCRIPTVGLTIGEPCERRQQNERNTANCRTGGRNVRKKSGALHE